MFSITADELPRFMACTGSRDLNQFTNPAKPENPSRAEGIAAHWLIEQIWKGHHVAEELIDRQAPNGVFITGEMVEHVTSYLDSLSKEGGNIEHVTTFSDSAGAWEVRARADYVRFESGVLTVQDFKYGWGVVEPENNWTLIAHAIGFGLQMVHHHGYNLLQDVRRIDLVVYQPRSYHSDGKMRTWSIGAQQLLDFHKQLGDTITQKERLLTTGPHCKNCPSAQYCPAFSQAGMNVIDLSERPFDDEIDNVSLAHMLDNFNRASDVIKQALEAYADLASVRIRDGQIVEGYAMKSDLSNKQWKDGITADFVQTVTGIDVSKKDIITPNQAVGAGVPKDVVDAFSERRNKGFKLVRADANKIAKKLFNQPI